MLATWMHTIRHAIRFIVVAEPRLVYLCSRSVQDTYTFVYPIFIHGALYLENKGIC